MACVIVYESKRGFTQQYAKMLSEKTGFPALPTKDIKKVNMNDQVIFLGWIMAGILKGFKSVAKHNLIAVCGCGLSTGLTTSQDEFTLRNNIPDVPFFYLTGGCKPLSEIKGPDKFILKMLVSMTKKQPNKTDQSEKMISKIENGFSEVNEESLLPILNFLSENK